jgi:hypothetical protein
MGGHIGHLRYLCVLLCKIIHSIADCGLRINEAGDGAGGWAAVPGPAAASEQAFFSVFY